jgi:hypothetical protein
MHVLAVRVCKKTLPSSKKGAINAIIHYIFETCFSTKRRFFDTLQFRQPAAWQRGFYLSIVAAKPPQLTSKKYFSETLSNAQIRLHAKEPNEQASHIYYWWIGVLPLWVWGTRCVRPGRDLAAIRFVSCCRRQPDPDCLSRLGSLFRRFGQTDIYCHRCLLYYRCPCRRRRRHHLSGTDTPSMTR